MNPHDPTQGPSYMGESKVTISYLYKDQIMIDLNREEGIEQISLNELTDLLEKKQHFLQEAWEKARVDRLRKEFYSRPDPVTGYMHDLIDKKERDAGY